jgi:2-aminoadipate transaminase
MLSEASRPDILSLALGLPAAELFPWEAYGRAAAQLLETDANALQYGPPSRVLKSQIVELMAQRGVACREEQVFLTAGAQQGINLLARLLLEPGGSVMTEELTYTGCQQVLEPYQPKVLSVPTSAQSGIDVDAVETYLENGARPAFIYTVTDGHNPLGVSLSREKRERLAGLAREFRVPIIEDDPYGFIHYEAATPPLRAFDENFVYYVGSFSKILAPALRAGWLVVPEALSMHLSIIKEASDIDTGTFSQRAISTFIANGHLNGHLEKLRREYATRRDAMLSSLGEHFAADARWNVPTSGIFIWVELQREVSTMELLKLAIERERVAFIPGQAFSVGGTPRATNCMRLNFSHSSAERIEEGVSRLARCLRLIERA